MQSGKFSITKRIRSFYYAFNGIKTAICTQHNMQIHLIAALFVVVLSYLLNINSTEWIIIIICIAIVIASEIFNSSIELLTDIASPEDNPVAGKVKDMAAGAVLIAAIAACIVGFIIFVPKIYQLIL